mmetsp:Transcript_16383/g.32961  ORF Transcript_16383/g.32961 Transcript_16383/m.32961 type:complete len:209 (+) Transcript_16383:115-741(+)
MYGSDTALSHIHNSRRPSQSHASGHHGELRECVPHSRCGAVVMTHRCGYRKSFPKAWASHPPWHIAPVPSSPPSPHQRASTRPEPSCSCTSAHQRTAVLQRCMHTRGGTHPPSPRHSSLECETEHRSSSADISSRRPPFLPTIRREGRDTWLRLLLAAAEGELACPSCQLAETGAVAVGLRGGGGPGASVVELNVCKRLLFGCHRRCG